ncbi:MAG: type II toxin-antitoxin system death-on-curing family toxin [Anaerolineaceae bacterium]|nr:type II toxin-antitoxin system death-on-curing family toxin [Anaerolineaceae bacterium]
MIQYLTPEQVLFLHSRLITETGGLHGIRDLGMLLSAPGRPLAIFEGKDLYPDLFSKTAALMDSLVRNHPFVDGNKRTAITASGLFLRMNGLRLVVENDEMVQFTLACAQSYLSFAEISAWFKKYTIPSTPSSAPKPR